MFERIAVAVDGSALSTQALEHAGQLAKALPAKLEVLHVVPDPPFPSVPPFGAPLTLPNLEEQFAALERESARILLQARERLTALGVLHEVVTRSTRARGERIGDVIVRMAVESGAELIVAGTHGRGGWDRWLLGSTASRVAHRANVPVLLIPALEHKPHG